jgi:hypothetical protein
MLRCCWTRMDPMGHGWTAYGRTLPPPRRLRATLSLPSDRPAEAQEFCHFWRAAVHLGLASEARNLSLTPGFLCGCSLGPLGTLDRPGPPSQSRRARNAKRGPMPTVLRWSVRRQLWAGLRSERLVMPRSDRFQLTRTESAAASTPPERLQEICRVLPSAACRGPSRRCQAMPS